MTTMTIAAPTGDQDRDLDYYAGRADAYDEHTAGADADTLNDRFEWMTDPSVAHNTRQLVSTAYLHGYQAYIQNLRAEQYWTRYTADLEHAAWLETTP